MKALADSKSWSIYQSCRQIPLNRFINISLGGNLSLLDRTYQPDSDRTSQRIPIEVLRAVWSDMCIEYSDLMDNGDIRDLLIRKLELDNMISRLNTLIAALTVLRDWYDAELVEYLQQNGIDMPFDPKNEIEYVGSVNKALKKLKPLRVAIRVKESEIARLGATTVDEEQNSKTEDDWLEEKAVLSDESGRGLDWDTLTVYEFAWRYKRLKRKLEAQQNKQKKV